MPSPFPGMDPYLEDPDCWPDVHDRLVIYMADALVQDLPPGFHVSVQQRLYVVETLRTLYSDVTISSRPTVSGRQVSRGHDSGTALADPPQIVGVLDDELREPFLEIRSKHGQVVTVVEVLSPTNKAANSSGHRKHAIKQQETLDSGVNLLEVDLLRQGTHTVSAPEALLSRLSPWLYLVVLHRCEAGGHNECWPIGLRTRLPRVAVPLDVGTPDVILDLQQLVERTYDGGGYADWLDYTADPVPPLDAEEAAWADALLRWKALRA